MPSPCSPVIDPPILQTASKHSSIISARTLLSAAELGSSSGLMWRFASPAWPYDMYGSPLPSNWFFSRATRSPSRPGGTTRSSTPGRSALTPTLISCASVRISFLTAIADASSPASDIARGS